MDSPPPAKPSLPPVVLIMVTHDPGEWFDETLRSVVDQNYDALEVLVVDTGSEVDPTPRIADVLPAAFVRRLGEDPGYGAAANLAHSMVEGAAFYLFCHDDILLRPGAVRAMVEEAFRSNGGLVTPKILDWDDPDEILSVGMAADKFGCAATFVDPGEVDQEQHDAVRDVFLAPGGCVLVRADLFGALGGFDEGITFLGDALALSWRAHLAGARVIVVPEAVVLHRQVLSERKAPSENRELEQRHRLRIVLSNYGWFHLIRVLPQYVLLVAGQVLVDLVMARPGRAVQPLRAVWWNMRHLGEIRENRKAVKEIRSVSDSEVRSLQSRGSAELSAFIGRRLEGQDDRLADLATRGRGFGRRLRDPQFRPALLIASVLALIVVVGSRQILTEGMAQFGEFAAFTDHPWTLLREYLSSSQASGVGADGAPPTAFGLLGAGGILLFTKMDLLRTVLSIGLLPVGGWATWRLSRGLGLSPNAAIVSVVAALAVPLPYNAFNTGSWSGLLAWAVVPIVTHALARALDAPEPARPVSSFRTIVALGLVLWLATSFVPFLFVLVAALVVALALGSVLAGQVEGTASMATVGLGSLLVAAILNLPWLLGLGLDGFTWASIGGTRHGGPVSADDLLKFFTGAHGAGPLGWALPVAATVALLVGRGWRKVWGVRLATVFVFFWVAALVAEMGAFPVDLPRPEVLLAPAAMSVAVLVGMVVSCYELDLAEVRFGWRQVAIGVAAVAFLGATLSLTGAAFDGRWDSPDERVTARLALFEQDDASWYRTLWLGDADSLPVAGWPTTAELTWALNDAGPPTVRDRFVDEDAATSTIGAALADVLEGRTQRFGPLLLGSGVRYVVIPLPVGADEPPPELAAAIGKLDQQLDLERLNATSAMVVYRNAAWVPVVASAPADALPPSRSFEQALAFPTDSANGRLADDELAGAVRFTGRTMSSDEALLVGFGAGDSWTLSVDGVELDRSPAFGWASSYPIDGTAEAVLSRSTSGWRVAALVGQALALIVAVGLLVGTLGRSTIADPEAEADT